MKKTHDEIKKGLEGCGMEKMRRKHCKHCKDGVKMVAFVFADDENCVVHYADYCPVCGRRLNNILSEWGD